MKDIRDPIDVYNEILAEKTAWNCSVLEAADRIEAERRNQPLALATKVFRAASALPLQPGREEGVQ